MLQNPFLIYRRLYRKTIWRVSIPGPVYVTVVGLSSIQVAVPAWEILYRVSQRPVNKNLRGLQIVINETEIYERLTPVFQDVFDDDMLVPHADMTAADVEDWDSLSNIRLVVAVEEEFEMLFTTGEVAGLNDVGEFVKVIQKRASE